MVEDITSAAAVRVCGMPPYSDNCKIQLEFLQLINCVMPWFKKAAMDGIASHHKDYDATVVGW